MSRALSGKRVHELMLKLDEKRRKAIQMWLDMEMDFLREKFPDIEEFQTKKIGLIDYMDDGGTCSHCKNYNIRFTLYVEDIRSGDRKEIAVSKHCLAEYFNLTDQNAIDVMYSGIRDKIRMRDELLLQLEKIDFAPVKYPPNLRVKSKIDVLIIARLPIPQRYALDVRVEANKLKTIQEKSEYYIKYRKYIRYVRLSLKLQPRNPFLLSIQERMRKNIPLTPGIIEALEKGMTEGWEERLKEAIANMEKHSEDMLDHERRINRLLMCNCGLARSVILSFRNQLRRGRPLSPKQIETLEKWEERFANQLYKLDQDDNVILA